MPPLIWRDDASINIECGAHDECMDALLYTDWKDNIQCPTQTMLLLLPVASL